MKRIGCCVSTNEVFIFLLTIVCSVNSIFQIWFYNVQRFASKSHARAYLAAIILRVITSVVLTIYATCSLSNRINEAKNAIEDHLKSN